MLGASRKLLLADLQCAISAETVRVEPDAVDVQLGMMHSYAGSQHDKGLRRNSLASAAHSIAAVKGACVVEQVCAHLSRVDVPQV